MAKKQMSDKAGYILFLCIGLMFVVIGIYLLISSFSAQKNCTEEVDAVVVDMVTVKAGKAKHKHITYAPVFGYDYEGQTYQVQSRTSQRPAKYKVGERVTIFIDPSSPEEIYIPSDEGDRWLFVALTAGGALFAAIGGIALLKSRPKPESEFENFLNGG